MLLYARYRIELNRTINHLLVDIVNHYIFFGRCLPRAPRYLREKLISNSKLMASPLLTRSSVVTSGIESPSFESSTSSETYNHRHSVMFETDSYSDNSSVLSSCSDENSFTTGISASNSDLIFGDSGSIWSQRISLE